MNDVIQIIAELIQDGERLYNPLLPKDPHWEFRPKQMKDEFIRNTFSEAYWQYSYRWQTRCVDLLNKHVLNTEADNFRNTQPTMGASHDYYGFIGIMVNKLNFLKALKDDLTNHPQDWADKIKLPKVTLNSPTTNMPITTIELISKKFHKVVVQLKERRKERTSLLINDEYDVQYLMGALLTVFFDDIRPEEYTPSYAGSTNKMDFLLKAEGIVVETKKTSSTLKDKIIGDQLTIDIARYKKHSDCKTLICFIYDPENNLKNPSCIKKDLSTKEPDFEVIVFIVP